MKFYENDSGRLILIFRSSHRRAPGQPTAPSTCTEHSVTCARRAVIAKATNTVQKTKEKYGSSTRCAVVAGVPLGCGARRVPLLWCIHSAARAGAVRSLPDQHIEKYRVF